MRALYILCTFMYLTVVLPAQTDTGITSGPDRTVEDDGTTTDTNDTNTLSNSQIGSSQHQIVSNITKEDPDLSSVTEYIEQNPPSDSLMNQENFAIFAPNNGGCESTEFCKGADFHTHQPRSSSEGNANTNNMLSYGKSFLIADIPAEGDIFHTGGGELKDVKVIERIENSKRESETPTRLARVYSGSGKVSYILKEKVIPQGVLYTMDSFFTIPTDFRDAVKAQKLQMLFQNEDSALDDLNSADYVTFFAPEAGTFANASSNLDKEKLKLLIDYHTISHPDFVGYTPFLKHEKTYKTKSGFSVVVSIKNGDMYINDAKIVGRNHITKNGVLHIINKVLELPGNDTHVKGPDGNLDINNDTAEDDGEYNPKETITVVSPDDGALWPSDTSAVGSRIGKSSFLTLCVTIGIVVGYAVL